MVAGRRAAAVEPGRRRALGPGLRLACATRGRERPDRARTVGRSCARTDARRPNYGWRQSSADCGGPPRGSDCAGANAPASSRRFRFLQAGPRAHGDVGVSILERGLEIAVGKVVSLSSLWLTVHRAPPGQADVPFIYDFRLHGNCRTVAEYSGTIPDTDAVR